MAIMTLDPLAQTFGLPPKTHVSDAMMINSMPFFEVTPCLPNFEQGLNLFSINPDVNNYKKILANHGYGITTMPIRFAFIADNFPTDSFVNDYGETFLQKFTDVASQGMSQIAQMTGSRSGTEAGRKIGQHMLQADKDIEGVLGDFFGAVGRTAISTASGINQAINSDAVKSLIGGGGDVLNKMVAGQRVDFPQVWRNSSFTPSYTATVRLYNPNPKSIESTRRHIIGPIAVLLCLALPRSDNGSTYSWPFFHKIRSSGIYNLSPAVITNVTVVKGGDQQQIAFNQRMGIVDVRVDFTSLYNSLLVEEKGRRSKNRPTLYSYLQSLEATDKTKYNDRADILEKSATAAGASPDPKSKEPITSKKPVDKPEDKIFTKKQSPKAKELNLGVRINVTSKGISVGLENQNPLYTVTF